MMKAQVLAAALSVATLFHAGSGRAAEVEEEKGLEPEQESSVEAHTMGYAGLFVRTNPMGVALVAAAAHRRVYGRNVEEGYETSYVQAGMNVVATPAYIEPGVHVEVLPVPFAILRLEANVFRFTGTLGGLLRFPTADEEFGDDVLQDRSGQEQATWAERAAAVGTLRFKAGWLLLRNETTAAYYHFDDPGPFLYESEYDTLMAPNDGIIVNRLAAFAVPWNPHPEKILLVGPTYEVTHTVETELDRGRLGVGAFWMTDSWGFVKRPQLLANVGVNLTDRNREGGVFAVFGVGAEME